MKKLRKGRQCTKKYTQQNPYQKGLPCSLCAGSHGAALKSNPQPSQATDPAVSFGKTLIGPGQWRYHLESGPLLKLGYSKGLRIDAERELWSVKRE